MEEIFENLKKMRADNIANEKNRRHINIDTIKNQIEKLAIECSGIENINIFDEQLDIVLNAIEKIIREEDMNNGTNKFDMYNTYLSNKPMISLYLQLGSKLLGGDIICLQSFSNVDYLTNLFSKGIELTKIIFKIQSDKIYYLDSLKYLAKENIKKELPDSIIKYTRHMMTAFPQKK